MTYAMAALILLVAAQRPYRFAFNRGREAGLVIAAELLVDAAEAVEEESTAVSSDYPVPGGRLL